MRQVAWDDREPGFRQEVRVHSDLGPWDLMAG